MTGRFRSSFMVLLLVVALLLTGVLAFQAYRAEEYHQETAGSVLQDYAELAAEELSSRVVQQVDYYGATPLRSYLAQSELPITFGLGTTTEVQSLTVTWPDGTVQEVEVEGLDRRIRIEKQGI